LNRTVRARIKRLHVEFGPNAAGVERIARGVGAQIERMAPPSTGIIAPVM
jgi:hypothetical protein